MIYPFKVAENLSNGFFFPYRVSAQDREGEAGKRYGPEKYDRVNAYH